MYLIFCNWYEMIIITCLFYAANDICQTICKRSSYQARKAITFYLMIHFPFGPINALNVNKHFYGVHNGLWSFYQHRSYFSSKSTQNLNIFHEYFLMMWLNDTRYGAFNGNILKVVFGNFNFVGLFAVGKFSLPGIDHS